MLAFEVFEALEANPALSGSLSELIPLLLEINAKAARCVYFPSFRSIYGRDRAFTLFADLGLYRLIADLNDPCDSSVSLDKANKFLETDN